MKNLFILTNQLQRFSFTLLLMCVLSLSFHSCSKSSSKKSTINPNDAAKLGDALKSSFPTGTKIKTGALPTPNTGTNRPNISASAGSSTNVLSGDEASFSFSVDRASGTLRVSSTGQSPYSGCYVGLPNYTSYWDVPAPSTTSTWTLPLNIPSNIGSGSFTLQICVYTRPDRDADDRSISNVITWTINTTYEDEDEPGPGPGPGGAGSARITVNSVNKNSIACVFSNTPPPGGEDEYDGCFTNVISIPLNNSTGEGLYLYNVPTGASATASISNFCKAVENSTGTSCASILYAIYVNNTSATSSAVSISGTFRKTGANSFTISNLVVRDYNESDVTFDDDCGYSGTTYNISGQGTYASF
jgi:hypothetical protein